MSETISEQPEELIEESLDEHDADGHDDDHHPSDWEYVKIAGWLAFLTLIEVGTYFESVHNLGRIPLILILTFLMIVKFVMVAAYFMHLKYDTNWFTRVFTTGIVLALTVYFIMLFAFRFFG